jgi:hypothetical protein
MKMNFVIQPEIRDLPINKKICFSNHNNKYIERIRKNQLKVLKNLAPLFKQFLEPEEEILYTVKACSPVSLLEQFTTGCILYYIKRCILVFTNKRILHFPTKINYSHKNSVAQVLYGDVENFKLSGLGGRIFELKYKNGKKEKFYYIKSMERKKLKNVLPLFVKNGTSSEIKQRHHLCPRCAVPLSLDEFSCLNCRLEFKNATQALKLSIFFPGGGYFYTRHPVLAFGDAITETILFVAVVVGVVEAFKGLGQWPAVMMISVVLLLEKLITIYHAKHFVNEYIPVEKSFTPIRSQ